MWTERMNSREPREREPRKLPRIPRPRRTFVLRSPGGFKAEKLESLRDSLLTRTPCPTTNLLELPAFVALLLIQSFFAFVILEKAK